MLRGLSFVLVAGTLWLAVNGRAARVDDAYWAVSPNQRFDIANNLWNPNATGRSAGQHAHFRNPRFSQRRVQRLFHHCLSVSRRNNHLFWHRPNLRRAHYVYDHYASGGVRWHSVRSAKPYHVHSHQF